PRWPLAVVLACYDKASGNLSGGGHNLPSMLPGLRDMTQLRLVIVSYMDLDLLHWHSLASAPLLSCRSGELLPIDWTYMRGSSGLVGDVAVQLTEGSGL